MDKPSPNFEFLEHEIQDGIATVWLSRPPVNAVSQQMYREIKALFTGALLTDPDVRVVVLAGRGKHFCAGNDLDEFVTLDPANSPGRMREVREAFFAIQNSPVPVIGAIHGFAVGTGLAIAASCDFLIAAEGAKLGTPEVSVGVMGGARHLMRIVPQPLARWMYFTAEPVDVSSLARYGTVTEVVAPDKLMDAAYEHARLVARYSPVVLRFAKSSLDRVEQMDLEEGYEYEQSLTGELSGHPHAKEALSALIERRPGNYQVPGR